MTSAVAVSSNKSLLKLGAKDVYDAAQAIADIRQHDPNFTIDLSADLPYMAYWFAKGSEEQRRRFVAANCPPRFLATPFAGFNGQTYKSAKKFQ